MTRFLSPRTTLLFVTLLTLGSLSTVSARQPEQKQDAQEQRNQRFEKRFGQHPPQHELAQPRVQVQSRVQAQPQMPAQVQPQVQPRTSLRSRIETPERREDWGEMARRGQQRATERAEQRQSVHREQADIERSNTDRSIRSRAFGMTPPVRVTPTQATPLISGRQRAVEQLDTKRQSSEWKTPSQRIIADAREREQTRRDNDWREDRSDDDQQRGDDNDHRVSYRQQQDRIEQQREWNADWQRKQTAQRAQAQHQREQLNRQNRHAQNRYQQDYWRRWHHSQERWHSHHRYDDYGNPYIRISFNYRYYFGDGWHFTSRYGADLLEQAIQDGYREGWYAGRADRSDGWRSDYRNNFSYLDGSFGYHGSYVSYSTYRHYFREGFERGYRDGYYRHYRYGRYDDDNGWAMILPLVLASILSFQID